MKHIAPEGCDKYILEECENGMHQVRIYRPEPWDKGSTLFKGPLKI